MTQWKIVETNDKKNLHWAEKSEQISKMEDVMHVINIYPEVKYQKFRGFGGAFTEASAHNYAGMNEKTRQEFQKAYFSAEGLNYNLGRIHMNSCDFALGNYDYLAPGDETLESFDISHDRKEIIPMIHDAQKNAAEPMEFLVSPWSPPAFMKTNGEMNHGGSLKKKYYDLWARYFAKFIREYEKEGIEIGYLTVQNEPQAVQTWDSCIYSSEEESIFVKNHLGPVLEEAGLSGVKIFVWDHNKEEGYQRMKEVIEDPAARKYVSGTAMHWYTGDHFESIELILKQFPEMEVFFTEGCVEYSRFADSGETEKAEMYAHDILGNLNAGITASFDWNLLLDEKGGPNHVGNFCAAPIMCDSKNDTFEKRLSYYYIGQFSRYIKPGAVRIGSTRYTDKIEITAFCNPDGERVVVLLNKSKEDIPVTLRENGKGLELTVAANSIVTVLCS
ncbi:MAG: glycoside hydrolase family 30 beta sandwich domain-containing protein [Lachnospiraceae bacterium]|nr:glycoside hydrolase family 30 beta sandwich domain-containing protein [Lachnospiraceae bacterium]